MRISKALGAIAVASTAFSGIAAPAVLAKSKKKKKTDYTVTGGTITATFSPLTVGALAALHISVTTSAPTTAPSPTSVAFPIKSGKINTKTGKASFKGVSGGADVYTQSTSGHMLTLTNASVTLGSASSLNVAIDGKIGPYLTLTGSTKPKIKGSKATFSALTAALTPTAATVFDAVFTTNLLQPNVTVATVTITAKVK